MKTYHITIAGETFPIRSDADEDHVVQLAKEVQRRFETLNNRKGPRASQALRAMSMVALVLLDELSELKAQHDNVNKKAVSFAKSMSQKIDAILAEGVVKGRE